MVAALSVAANPKARKPVVITGTGFANTTAYVLSITDPDGGVTRPTVTSDGGGGFTFTYVPMGIGTISVSARPLTEHIGTTTATATATGTTTHGGEN